MKQLHKRVFVGLVFIALVTANFKTYSFFCIADLRQASSRIALATRNAMSSLRNFLVPVRFTALSKSQLPKGAPSKIGEKVANFAATAADKIGSVCDDAKSRAQVAKESLKLKAHEASERIKRISFWDRLRLSNFFGGSVELV